MLNLAVSLPLTLLAILTCYWLTYAWHSPRREQETTYVRTRDAASRSFSIIVPLRDEPYRLVAETVGCLLRQTHPWVQVLLSVGYDDQATIDVCRQLQAENPGLVELVISDSDVHNKPTQLNAALPACRNDIVGILDAESLAAPDLLNQVDALYQDAEVDVVQGGVVLVNQRASWVSLRSCLEYYGHFRSKLHWSASQGFIALGGNTVFFRRTLLEKLGGWDATNLAEDAEIGVRLSTLGHGVRVAYDPHLVTREEAPTTMRAWTKQRTRWNLGFIQTFMKGVWRQLPTRRQRLLAAWTLLQPTFVSVTGLAIPIAIITGVFTKPPLVVTMLCFAPAFPTFLSIVQELVILRTYGQEQDTKIRIRDYAKFVVTIPVYQLMSAYAALRALVKYLRGDFAWSKTHHPGSHLPGEASPVAA